jgi:hypothetical protein
MWLPALGAALFLLVGLWWSTRTEAPQVAAIAAESGDGGANVADGGAPSQGAAPQGVAQAQAGARPSAGAAGAGGGDASVQQLNPDQAAQLQKILQGMGH